MMSILGKDFLPRCTPKHKGQLPIPVSPTELQLAYSIQKSQIQTLPEDQRALWLKTLYSKFKLFLKSSPIETELGYYANSIIEMSVVSVLINRDAWTPHLIHLIHNLLSLIVPQRLDIVEGQTLNRLADSVLRLQCALIDLAPAPSYPGFDLDTERLREYPGFAWHAVLVTNTDFLLMFVEGGDLTWDLLLIERLTLKTLDSDVSDAWTRQLLGISFPDTRLSESLLRILIMVESGNYNPHTAAETIDIVGSHMLELDNHEKTLMLCLIVIAGEVSSFPRMLTSINQKANGFWPRILKMVNQYPANPDMARQVLKLLNNFVVMAKTDGGAGFHAVKKLIDDPEFKIFYDGPAKTPKCGDLLTTFHYATDSIRNPSDPAARLLEAYDYRLDYSAPEYPRLLLESKPCPQCDDLKTATPPPTLDNSTELIEPQCPTCQGNFGRCISQLTPQEIGEEPQARFPHGFIQKSAIKHPPNSAKPSTSATFFARLRTIFRSEPIKTERASELPHAHAAEPLHAHDSQVAHGNALKLPDDVAKVPEDAENFSEFAADVSQVYASKLSEVDAKFLEDAAKLPEGAADPRHAYSKKLAQDPTEPPHANGSKFPKNDAKLPEVAAELPESDSKIQAGFAKPEINEEGDPLTPTSHSEIGSRADDVHDAGGLYDHSTQGAFEPTQCAFEPTQCAFEPTQCAFEPTQCAFEPTQCAFERTQGDFEAPQIEKKRTFTEEQMAQSSSSGTKLSKGQRYRRNRAIRKLEAETTSYKSSKGY